MDLRNKKVTIIGLARSGKAVAELILHFGGAVRISDSGEAQKIKRSLDEWPFQEKIRLELGRHTQEFIEESDLVVLSPGVRIDAPPVLWARKKKIPVLGEVELAWRFCSKPVIAVTGSNGKTTVSTLIKEMLTAAGKKVCLCGNIGSPFSKYVLDLTGKDFIVLEISSFQLESVIDFCPHVAVFLNFSQNHLDRHKDIQEYFEAKKRIFMNQTKDDFAVLNFADGAIRPLAPQLKAKVSFFSQTLPDPYGLTSPNHLAVMEVGKILGVSPKVSLEVFKNFKGVEHRMEFVRSIAGVDFINDSKATTAEAARWALTSVKKPIVMICGGRDKNIDFSVLKALVGERVKKMLVIGEAKEKIKRTFQDVVSVEECDLLEKAVRRAQESAAAGDCVVFSPMCASFDMFANFEERGKVFKEIVSKL